MSEPVTNVDVEDVLSSVRRLVSAKSQGKIPLHVTHTAEAPQAEKLVLTPALRVLTPEEMVESPEEPDDVEDIWQPETAGSSGNEAALAYDPALGSRLISARNSLEATIAELEAAVIAQPDEWEPDGSEVTSEPTWETVTYLPLEDVEDAEAVEESTPQEVRDDRILRSGPLILENADRTVDQTIEGDTDTLSPQDLTFKHVQPIHTPVETEVEEEEVDYGDDLAPDPEPEAEDQSANMQSNVPAIEEAVLRDLVAEVLRNELQGKLGERITRNVRKMVRRELSRALDIKDLD